jgi:sterol desaturase/sphingolipid hydroxylase (fatty acid hydroxylase superfamily)
MIDNITLVVSDILQLPSLQRLILYFVGIGLTFGLLERLFPATRRGIVRPNMGIDLFYWFFTPVVVKLITSMILVIVVWFVFYVLSWPLSEDSLRGFGPISKQPSWLQIIEMLFLADLIGYWMHRWFHVTCLWRFHAVHHSPKHLDWLSAYRMHPLNDAASRVIQTLPLLLLGFSPLLLMEYVPFIVVYVVFLHTNIRWTFGPFKYVIASPSFHRWHHASEEAALDRNYATMFPVWDLLFGTYFLPDRQPEKYGVKDDSVPESFFGQMLHPFVWRRPATK